MLPCNTIIDKKSNYKGWKILQSKRMNAKFIRYGEHKF